MAKNEKYFNFPIQLLEGFLVDSKTCLNNICDYAIYNHSLNLEYGDEIKCVEASANYYNLVLGDSNHTYKKGKELHIKTPDNSPMVGINLSIFWEFFKDYKTDFEKVCLIGFLAFKSILQDKPYCKITNKFWLARMNGKAKSHEFNELPEPLKKYANEYQLRKIKRELQHNWFLVEYGHYTRGFYVSFKLPLEKLVYEVEKRKKSTKDKQLIEAKKKARADALSQLNK